MILCLCYGKNTHWHGTLPGIDPDTFIGSDPSAENKIEDLFPGISEIYDEMLLRKIDGEFPIAAAVAIPNIATGLYERVSIANNRTNGDRNSTHHAEILAIELALQQLNDKHLPKGAVLISTVEPCSMCASALGHCQGENLIYGVSQKELSGRTVNISGTDKEFRTEDTGYEASSYLPDTAVIIGNFRLTETLAALGQIN